MWRVFVIVWIQASGGGGSGGNGGGGWGGGGKMCSCKRNITFIISCQFQKGLRILKTLFDFYVFFKCRQEKNSHCMCFVFRCLWQHNLKSILNVFLFVFFFFFWDELTLPDTESPEVNFRSRLPPAVESLKKKSTQVDTKWISVPFSFFQYFSYLLHFFFDKHDSSDKCMFEI